MRLLAILLLAGLIGGGALAEGDRHYRRGDMNAAAAAYGRALAEGDSSAVVHYNLGTTLLRLGRYDEARTHLQAAAGARSARPLPFRAAYNAGNADLVPVASGAVPQPQRVARLTRAVENYRRALLRDPNDADAKWNLEIAQRLLARESGGGGNSPDDKPDGAPQGGEGDQPSPATPQPQPGPAEGGDTDGPMTREQAERILSGAEQRDQQVQRRQLKREQTNHAGLRDW